jgi:hypothetical protein
VDAACERAAWPPIRTMWQDSSAENEFMARGPFYLEDKAKVPAGAACLRLVAVLMYGCRPQDGDRIDHVASRGKCAKLVQALGAITAEAGRAPNEPCLFIVNIQVYEYAGSAPLVCVPRQFEASNVHPVPESHAPLFSETGRRSVRTSALRVVLGLGRALGFTNCLYVRLCACACRCWSAPDAVV